MSNAPQFKPVIGISIGDINGIGTELVIRTFSDSRMLDICTPVIFANNKLINFYRKTLPDLNFSYQSCKEDRRFNPKQVNVFHCWEEDINVTPGQLTETGGTYAIKSLVAATQALKEGWIDGLVTAPIHKKNVQSETFKHSGHTPFLKEAFEAKDVLMFMTAENIRVGLVTEHLPVAEVAKHITKEAIISKLQLMRDSLIRDFGIDKPRIAVLGLNPHAGDEGLIGNEEETIIRPAIKEMKQHNALVFGPYPADAFFARGQHERFDGVLAMYHDQGLIPFKSLAIGEGVNYTAGLKAIRTSPDHGTAFDIAGKNKADASSFIAAIFGCVDIIRQRSEYKENRKNPLRRITSVVLANTEDEKLEEE
ncbi:4-hydroxythreonine-4-phosphate dehydrogenase PdxA [Parasegetibacter sp. NRK P23]|uniref:4-hydroxythreonine-4-phosphate dehydrogenase PdxA n=1 Tax=Parasegetibacter sp. NRK P23 TaxID=2942999 RepID=UPI0020441700|nr:4-hydroxythreonine-4-phosphate dehydrogenase PdxA [Parasegetibacter sp. NRK P23]MCM5529581.1 4-hydroxythreonine-4-phosphate dehydrogenase PdxA [Parasegetibacter sp. NRK P23]